MKCPKCGNDAKKKTGKVSGHPEQSSEFYECVKCGLHSGHKIIGIRIFDEFDAQQEKNASKSKIVS